MKSPIIFSGLFTPGIFGVHKAPENYRSIFFTNNKSIANEAERLGWIPCLMPFPETDSAQENSLISKRVKFLGVLDMEPVKTMALNFKGGVLYFDHKFMVHKRHVQKIVEMVGDSKVLIRATPRRKTSIWQEVEEASRQERYARSMPETIRFIEAKLKAGFKAETLICNTGLIYYSDVDDARSLANEVLNSCLQLRQPECQILWALHAQHAAEKIKVINWRDPAVADIHWKDPVSSKNFPEGNLGRLRRLGWWLGDLLTN